MSACWEALPEVVLGNVFSNLDIASKIAIRSTCLHWRRASSRPEVWKSFSYSERMIWESMFPLTMPASMEDFERYRKFHEELLFCVKMYGAFFTDVELEVKGTQSSEVFDRLSKVSHKVNSLTLLKRIEGETFSGRLKTAIFQFCKRNVRMTNVRIDDLNFQGQKNETLPLGLGHSSCLQKLRIVNSFKDCSLSNLMYLVNLKELTINPNQMNFSLLKHLAGCSLRQLNIMANYKTKDFYNEALSNFHWKEIRKCGPKLRVHCQLAVLHEWTEKEILLKASMPLSSLVYRKNRWVKCWPELGRILSNYGDTLDELVDFSLSERVYNHSDDMEFSDRIDEHILDIIKCCPKLLTFTVKETLSSATILLIAFQKRNFPNLLIREDMIIYLNDLPDDITADVAARNFVDNNWEKGMFCRAMSFLLGREWHPLNKAEYYQLVQAKYSELF
ncbi:uncharacterized protein LOC110442233 [Mizuhopecten yessoensis]|uniref:F-box domain-containing protein n=1 Tax=Mizuhopecten yessoensis TaxID=6573 RepID=A0A210PHP0_MIZYE|nr:uncharacterized protein LOC110442233 [Mizuhopecten yessoensis]OWF36000.1 hypothetical protein KP79_PYT07657 [Mizuhopecten yessoensis]